MPAYIRFVSTGGGGGGTGLSVAFTPSALNVYSSFVGDTVYGSVAAGVVGGTGPYTYAWTRLSGNVQIGIDNAAIANPTFSATGPRTSSIIYEALWRLTVTDSLSAVVTADLNITMQIGGGPIS